MKPDPRIYALTTERCRLVPEKTLFVDDLAINVAAGRDAGWHAIQLLSPQQLALDLSELGLLPQAAIEQC